MGRCRFLAVCSASLLILGFAAIATPTQEAGNDAAAASSAGKAIGLLDVGYIYKNYPRFTESLAKLKTDVESAEVEAKEQGKALAGMQKELTLLVVGSPEYAELEKRITMSQAALAGRIETQKKAFVRRQARLYYDVYREITRAVEDYAPENDIAVVLRFSDDSVNANDPKDILQHINRPVVWHDGGRDLTRIILQRLIQESKEPEGDKQPPPKDPSEPTPEPPMEPEQENRDGHSQRASHLGQDGGSLPVAEGPN